MVRKFSITREQTILQMQRRIIVLAVPPVEELDLVGPIQVLGAANRLSRKSIYTVEIVTHRKDLEVKGEGGLLSFQAAGHFRSLKGNLDSLLVGSGLSTIIGRDRTILAVMRRRYP